MRVLMISKTFVSSTAQRKLEELAKYPDVELTLVTPAYWQNIYRNYPPPFHQIERKGFEKGIAEEVVSED